ncbi:MAG TPA: hypothetical protein VII49_03645 [Rhizomicrobium sp.]
MATLQYPRCADEAQYRRSFAICLILVAGLILTAATPGVAAPPHKIGLNGLVVKDALGGQILGFDIDQNGTEGLLSEYVALGNGENNIATETFDQKTGKIIKILKEINNTYDTFATYGVVGTNVGLDQFDRTHSIYQGKVSYDLLNPLDGNEINGNWTPPLTKHDVLWSVSENQGQPTTAVLAFKNSDNSNDTALVFGSDIANNTFGPGVKLTDSVFNLNAGPVMAFDSATNQAIVAASLGCYDCLPTLALVDVVKGTTTEFTGVGFGFVDGIAVDSADGIVCTASDDFSLEFYNLATQSGFEVTLENATSPAQSGEDIEFDPINKLFLVQQYITSTGASGSSIQVYDTQGNYVESINDLSLPASDSLIALQPSKRIGFLYGLTELVSFNY